MSFLTNIILSALIIGITVEVGKRSSMFAAMIISLPVSSIIALSLLYFQSHDQAKVLALSQGIFLMLLPSLLFFLMLSFFIKAGVRVPTALPLSCAAMIVAYWSYSRLLTHLGVKF